MAATLRSAVAPAPGAALTSINAPAGVAAGDFLILFVVFDNIPGPIGVTGGATWNTLGSQQNITNGDSQEFQVFYKFAGGSEPSSYGLTGAAGQDAAAVIMAWTGVDTTTPIQTSSTTNPNLVSPPTPPVSLTASSITTTVANQTLIWMGGVDWNFNGSPTYSAPTACPTTVGISSGSSWASAAVFYGTQASAGATGSVISTSSESGASAGNYVAYLLALTDAAGGGNSAPIYWTS